jgi:hypothetical protein
MEASMKTLLITTIFVFCAAQAARAEPIDCSTKPEAEDLHARVVLDIKNGKVQEFLYYCKFKPYTCSIDSRRGSSWKDSGNKTLIPVGSGQVEITKLDDEHHVSFKNIDRSKFCKMPPGKINGTFVIRKDKTCVEKDGLMLRASN